MADLGAMAPARSLAAQAGAFLRWWLVELAGLVPARLRGRFGGGAGQLVVALRSAEVVLTHRRQGRAIEVGRVPLDPAAPETARPAIAEALSASRLAAAETLLVLPEHQVLCRPVDLPIAARENLREVMAFEMDRFTPFAADAVEFDLRPVAADEEAHTVTVALAAVPRDVADRWVAVARGWGLTPDLVCFAADPDSAAPRDTFVFRRREGGGRRLSRRLAIGLWLAAAVLALTLAVVPLQRKQEALAAYEAQLDQRRTEAAAVDALRRQVAEMADISDRLWREKTGRPATIVLLNEVTRLLPDDTWLLQLRLAGDRMTLSGYSEAASALIPVLEASELLREVRFDAPVTRDGRVGLERFNLSATVVGAAAEDGS